jgi:hypothetical protein
MCSGSFSCISICFCLPMFMSVKSLGDSPHGMVGWMSNSPTCESRDPPLLIGEGFLNGYMYAYIYIHDILIPHEFQVVYVRKKYQIIYVSNY